MSVVKHFITESIKRTEIDEYLQKKIDRAGYGGVNISKTPLGTHIVIYAMRPGIVIGRGGETIRELAAFLGEKFGVSNPQISVSEIEVPELNAYVVASRVASALQRGVHFRRAGFWSLNQVMEAGALGCEIVISGKLRTERARFEKFRAGYLIKCGEPSLRYMQKAVAHVQLKPGMMGIRVRILPPDTVFPDKLKIADTLPPEDELAAKVAEKEAKSVEVDLDEGATEETVQEAAQQAVEAKEAETAETNTKEAEAKETQTKEAESKEAEAKEPETQEPKPEEEAPK
jgi:small subunit ribosomal protein S3